MDVKRVLVAILLIELAISFALGVGENEPSKQVYIVVKIDFISCQNFNFYCKGIYSEQYKAILVCSDPCNEFNTIYFSWLNSSCCLTNKYTYLIEIHYESSNAKSIIH